MRVEDWVKVVVLNPLGVEGLIRDVSSKLHSRWSIR